MARRILDSLYGVALVLATVCLAAIAALILAQVVGRWFGVLVPAAEEFAGYLMAGATFLALAHTLRSDGHIRVTLVISRFPAVARRWQELLVLSLTLALSAALSWWCIELVAESVTYGDTSGGQLPVPLWIPQVPMALGLTLFTVALADELLARLRGQAPEQAQPAASADL
jgi:TRAP-type C4-dicarboxylate transport system permease small subunit